MWSKIIKIPVEVSARHVHICQKDLEALFGAGHELNKIKQLFQPSEFACQETVDIEINSNVLKNIRIVGPVREKTQVEISLTDAVNLKINPPVKLSGDLENSEAFSLIGPKGSVGLSEGLIIAKRHLHCGTEEAKKLGFKNNDKISVEISGERKIIFKEVVVRVKDNYKLCVHLDTDEGNAAGINKIGEGEIIK